MFSKKLFAILTATFVVFCIAGCGEAERQKRRKESVEQEPVLISTKNGVQLWRVYDKEHSTCTPIYFTTPTGDVAWTVTGGEDTPDEYKQVPGVKKKN